VWTALQSVTASLKIRGGGIITGSSLRFADRFEIGGLRAWGRRFDMPVIVIIFTAMRIKKEVER
jgi:hypothetical protein